MAQCKECLHYGVCAKEGRLVQVDEHTWDEYNLLPNVEQFCTSYFNADVVPKSEVENILDILIKEAGEIAESYKVRIAELNGLEYADRVKSEYIGTQVGALLVQLRIAQLKKKYTESEDEG